MTKQKIEEVHLWLLKSQQDLAVAQLLVEQQHNSLVLPFITVNNLLRKDLKLI
jgi:hypothetical protein